MAPARLRQPGYQRSPEELCAVDIDILELHAAARAADLGDEHLGVSPLVRIGQEPKSLRIYRADGTITSSKPHTIEIFCGTGQVAVFGWHAKAGCPYLWPDRSPLVLEASSTEIPMITAQHVRCLLAAAAPTTHTVT